MGPSRCVRKHASSQRPCMCECAGSLIFPVSSPGLNEPCIHKLQASHTLFMDKQRTCEALQLLQMCTSALSCVLAGGTVLWLCSSDTLKLPVLAVDLYEASDGGPPEICARPCLDCCLGMVSRYGSSAVCTRNSPLSSRFASLTRASSPSVRAFVETLQCLVTCSSLKQPDDL
jgi:hypothetical protein